MFSNACNYVKSLMGISAFAYKNGLGIMPYMKKDYSAVRIYKDSKKRLKVKAAQEGVSFIEMVDKLSRI